jgi:hypothetical protein
VSDARIELRASMGAGGSWRDIPVVWVVVEESDNRVGELDVDLGEIYSPPPLRSLSAVYSPTFIGCCRALSQGAVQLDHIHRYRDSIDAPLTFHLLSAIRPIPFNLFIVCRLRCIV